MHRRMLAPGNYTEESHGILDADVALLVSCIPDYKSLKRNQCWGLA